jgi:hypothetical protein
MTNEQTPWPESASEICRLSERRLSAKLVPNFVDRGCHVVRAMNPHGSILKFLYQSRYCFFQVAPRLYSQGWIYPVPDPVLLRKSASARNRTQDLWLCSQELWPLDHRWGPIWYEIPKHQFQSKNAHGHIYRCMRKKKHTHTRDTHIYNTPTMMLCKAIYNFRNCRG